MFKHLLRCLLFLSITFVSCNKEDFNQPNSIELDLKEYFNEHTEQETPKNNLFRDLNFEIEWSNYSITPYGNVIVPIRTHSSKPQTTLIGRFELFFERTNGQISKAIYRYVLPKNSEGQENYFIYNLKGEVIYNIKDQKEKLANSNNSYYRSVTNVYKQSCPQGLYFNLVTNMCDMPYVISGDRTPIYWVVYFADSYEPHYFLAPLEESPSYDQGTPNEALVVAFPDYFWSGNNYFDPYYVVNPNYNPDSGSSNGNPYENGGAGYGGGSSGNSGTDASNTIIVIAPVKEIVLSDRLVCFLNVPDNANTKYNITLHVDNSINFGHAFLTIEKSNGSQLQRLTYGFYPKTTSTFMTVTSTIFPTNSAIGEETEDGNRISDIRYRLSFTGATGKTIFNNVLNRSLMSASNPYLLTDYNCTDYAISVFNEALSTNKIDASSFYRPVQLHDLLKTMKRNGNTNITDTPINRIDLPKSTKCS